MSSVTSASSEPNTNFRRASFVGIKSINKYLKRESERFISSYGHKFDYNVSINNFKKISTLGAGTYGRVMLVKKHSSEHYYALKILDKKKIIQLEQIEHTLNEKKILEQLNHPFMIYMVYYFQDNSYLYFVLPFIAGGDLFFLLKKYNSLNEDVSRFYAAQVCLALEYLHNLKLVYRDLKPENILIDEAGYIKITDFGFCKLVDGRTYTLCGTPEYLAPEIVLSRGYSHAVDWWSYGILVFEMSAGFPPFRHKDPLVLYDRIAAGKYTAPVGFSISLRDLLTHILQTDLSKRFGNLTKGANDIKDHRWFKEINWLTLVNKAVTAPHVPEISSPADTKYFDKFVDEPLEVSLVNEFKKEFEEF